VIVEISSKKEIFGVIYKLIFKLHTKYVTMLVYVAGGESKLMSQS